jgi:hypothetical protein
MQIDVERWYNNTGSEHNSTRRKTCPSATLSAKNFGLNSKPRSERPSTSRLRNGRAIERQYLLKFYIGREFLPHNGKNPFPLKYPG